ncbi:hypothetical protein ACFOGI_13285 [Virgibacillus xinjiangensis]|uniref:Uncharacterized protein n=1 Tax=Virgibacillus xinjiangensis TaxID=393090 RepID=A0ABV7CXJ2_9BACI
MSCLLKLLKRSAAGVIAGILLGICLKSFELITGKAVYTLLLNIDYIPLVSDWELGEGGEFLLHLMVSVVIAPVLHYLLSHWHKERETVLYVAGSTVIGAAYYPVTILSEKTPALLDPAAFLLWISAHVLYGYVLAILLIYQEEKRSE